MLRPFTKESLCKLCAAMLVLAVADSHAGKWRLIPELTLTQTYSDNILLSPSATAEHEWISEIVPGLSLSRQTENADLDLKYRLQNLYFFRDQGRNETFQQIRGRGHWQQGSSGLYLDSSVDLSQQTVDANQPVPVDNLTAAGNRTNQMVFDIAPGLRGALGDGVLADVNVGHRQTEYERGRLDSYEERLSLNLSRSRPGRLDWELDGQRRQTRYADGFGDVIFETTLDLSYMVHRHWQLTAQAGYEDIRSSFPGDLDQASDSWRLGFIWTPSRRSRLEFSSGERFFGRNYELKWRHSSRRGQWMIEYSEDIETISSDPFVFDDFGLDGFSDFTTYLTDIYLSRRFSASFRRQSRRILVDLSANIERRTFGRTDGSERILAAQLRTRWQLASRTALHFDIGLTQRDALDAFERDTIRRAEFWLSYRIRKYGELTLKYRNLHRDGGFFISGYEVNDLILGYRLVWDKAL